MTDGYIGFEHEIVGTPVRHWQPLDAYTAWHAPPTQSHEIIGTWHKPSRPHDSCRLQVVCERLTQIVGYAHGSGMQSAAVEHSKR